MTNPNSAAQAAILALMLPRQPGQPASYEAFRRGYNCAIGDAVHVPSKLRASVANSMPIRLSAEVLEYLKEGIESATGCEESDVDYDFANELLRLINGPIYAAPQASAAITHYECGPHNGDGTYEAVPVCAAPQACEAVRIVFPAHLRKMWSGGEVQAWLDEHQGVTAPKASAKGSMERYRKWQAEQAMARNAGIELAARLDSAEGAAYVVLPRLPPITHKWASLISDSMAEALQNWAQAHARTAVLADRQQRAGDAIAPAAPCNRLEQATSHLQECAHVIGQERPDPMRASRAYADAMAFLVEIGKVPEGHSMAHKYCAARIYESLKEQS